MGPRLLPSAWIPALLLLGACRVVDAKVYNLREVHDPDGSPSRFGAPMKDMEYVFRSSFRTLRLTGGAFDASAKKPRPIEDPHGVCFEALLGLARCDAGDARTRALQVELFTWLAVDDQFVLSRERAVLELGGIGRRLGVESPRQLGEEDRPADATRVAGLLQELIETTRPAVTRQGPPGPPGALAELCATVREVPLDREGARRLVAAITILLDAGGGESPELEPLRELHLHLQRTAVELALGQALRDGDDRVRAAAIEASLDIGGADAGPLLLGTLGRDGGRIVPLRILRLIQERGLPIPEGLGPKERRETEDAWLETLLARAQNFDGEISAAACLALAAVSAAEPDAPDTLRWEEWTAWRRERRSPAL